MANKIVGKPKRLSIEILEKEPRKLIGGQEAGVRIKQTGGEDQEQKGHGKMAKAGEKALWNGLKV